MPVAPSKLDNEKHCGRGVDARVGKQEIGKTSHTGHNMGIKDNLLRALRWNARGTADVFVRRNVAAGHHARGDDQLAVHREAKYKGHRPLGECQMWLQNTNAACRPD